MTLITKEININGTTYEARFPIGQIIKAEKELGKPIADAKIDNLSDISILIKHSLKHPNGTYVTSDEMNEIIDNTSIDDFTTLLETISDVWGSDPEKTRKNRK